MMVFERRVYILLAGCALFATAIIVQAARVQLFPQPRLESIAKRQFKTRMLVRPMRGLILDRNGDRLTVNTETYSLAARPSVITSKREVARLISRAVDISVSKILPKIQEKREFIWIKRHLSESELARVKKLRLMDSEGDLREGLFLVRESERTYPHGSLAAHVLGSVNIDSEGLEGVELWQESLLRGKLASISAVKDALGRPAFFDADAASGGQDGENVSLTLDAHLQFAVEQELAQAVTKFGASAGTAVVMNAQSGEIFALASSPTFDPNHRAAPAERKRNRVLTDGFEPGSIVKPLVLAGALALGAKLTDQLYGERGQLIVQGKKISEAETHEKFEWMSLEKMIQVSSNVGAAKLALKLGSDAVTETLATFGLGKKTALGFPGEISGRVPPRKGMTPLTLANIGFGQGLLVTPLQMLSAYAVLANGGWPVEPKLIVSAEKTLAPSSRTSAGTPRLFSAGVIDAVIQALSSVTAPGGTGNKASLEGYPVAGKTGTAQVVDPETGAYSRTHYVASFVGFHSRWVIFTSLDDPRGAYYASETAAPLFRQILQAVVNRFQLPASRLAKARPSLEDSLGRVQAMPEPKNLPTLEAREVSQEGAAVSFEMPRLGGLSLREALRVFKGRSLSVEIQGQGTVVAQQPLPGAPLAEGDTIRLELGEKAEP